MSRVGYFKIVYVPVKPRESMLETYIHSPTTFKSSQVGTSPSNTSFSWLVGRGKMHRWPPQQPSDVSLGLPKNEGTYRAGSPRNEGTYRAGSPRIEGTHRGWVTQD